MLIREATASDGPVLSRLAQLDSSRVPPGRALLAFCDGEARAAISRADGSVVADPFHRTAELVGLLRLRAAQLAPRRRENRRGGVGLRRAPLPELERHSRTAEA